MITFATLLQAILPIYLLVALGCFLRWRRVVTAEMEKGLMSLVVHCLMPCLILDKILASELVRRPDVVGWGIGLGFTVVVTGFAVAGGVGRLLGLQRGSGARTFALAGGIQNYGYVAIPLLAVLFIKDGSNEALGMLFIHSLGVELALWLVGLMVLTGSVKGSLHLLINGPIVSVIVGLVLVYTQVDRAIAADSDWLLGQVVRQVMSWLGACAFPVALLLIGATMFGLIGEEKPSFKIGMGAILVRTFIMPCLIILAAKFLPLITELKQVLLVQAAMPAAVAPILMARLYGGRPGVAVQVVLTTALVGLVSMPLIVAWGMKFIGL